MVTATKANKAAPLGVTGRRAIIYTRQSDSEGEGERPLSLDSQARVLRADAERNGWIVIDELRDADLKGWDDHRPGLLSLYDRCRAGEVDIVAVWKLDRLARSVRITEAVVHELDRLGVELYSNQEPWAGNALFRQILAAVAEEQTRAISGHVRRALRERARRGLHHGRAPYGYDRVEDGRLSPNQDAETVCRIFQWRAEGVSYRGIARRLLAAGIPSPSGNPAWGRTSLAVVLTNPVYLGEVRLAEVGAEDVHPALVDAETWQRVQDAVPPVGQRTPREKSESSWLEGLVQHECGASMHFERGRTAKQRARLRCNGKAGQRRVDLPPCSYATKGLPVDRAEEIVWARITEDLSGLLNCQRVLALAREEYRRAAPEAERERREAERRKKKAEAARDRPTMPGAAGSTTARSTPGS